MVKSRNKSKAPVNSGDSFYVYVWELHVRGGCELEFERIYGPEGAWTRLFRRGSGHLRTELIRDKDVPNRYLTIDYWMDESSLWRFRREFSKEFHQLDQSCERLTDSEALIGDFLAVDAEESRQSVRGQ